MTGPFIPIAPPNDRQLLLLVVPWFSLGGSDRFNLNLIEQLREHGWDVIAVSTVTHDDDWIAEYMARSRDVIALHRHTVLENYPEFLTELIRSRGIDAVLVSHSELGYRLLPFLRARFPRLTLLDYVHVVDPTFHRGGFPRFAIEHQGVLDLSVAASCQVRDWMVARGMRPNRVAVCHVNVDTNRFRPDSRARAMVRSELKTPDHTVVVVFAGRLCPQKNPDVLAESLGALLHREPHTEAWIAGDGPGRAAFEAAICRRGVRERVRMLGALLPDRMAHVISGADLLFLPSRFEGIATVLFEAMACGIPVVASDVGGQRELVGDEGGMLIKPRSRRADVDHYVAALGQLSHTPDLRQRLGAAGRARVVAQFNVVAMGVRMVELIARARALRSREPIGRALPEQASQAATAAVEFARRSALAEQLRFGGRGATPGQRLYIRLNRWLSPLYDWGVARGWLWFPWAGERIRRLLVRKGSSLV